MLFPLKFSTLSSCTLKCACLNSSHWARAVEPQRLQGPPDEGEATLGYMSDEYETIKYYSRNSFVLYKPPPS